MNKAQLVAKVAQDAGVSKAVAEKTVNAFVDAVTSTLKKGGKVTIVGFGTFSTAKRKARIGRNPATGAELKIPATTVAKFSAGKALKSVIKRVKK